MVATLRRQLLLPVVAPIFDPGVQPFRIHMTIPVLFCRL
jgi:hypothetical protein